MAKETTKPATGTVNTTEVNDMLELNIDACLMIRPLSGTKPYTNTKEGSRYHGMSYRTFLYKGKGFTVISDDAFCKDIDEDNVDSVMLKSTDDGYEFLGHLSISRADRAHYTKTKRKAFTVEFIQNSKLINPEEFA